MTHRGSGSASGDGDAACSQITAGSLVIILYDLYECAFDLSDVDCRVETLPDVHNDVSP